MTCLSICITVRVCDVLDLYEADHACAILSVDKLAIFYDSDEARNKPVTQHSPGSKP